MISPAALSIRANALLRVLLVKRGLCNYVRPGHRVLMRTHSDGGAHPGIWFGCTDAALFAQGEIVLHWLFSSPLPGSGYHAWRMVVPG
jgi:hypothetical protein